MSDLFDYLAWRGDIPMSPAPFNPVDGLILSILSYVHFDNLVPPDLRGPISLGKAAETYLALPEGRRGRVRCPLDRKLLAALARCRRFSPLGLAFAQDRFVPEEEMQFAAIAVLLEDGSAFLSFRGTDATLVGWKEDFSMSFLTLSPPNRRPWTMWSGLPLSFLAPSGWAATPREAIWLSLPAPWPESKCGTESWPSTTTTAPASPGWCWTVRATRSC